jgi:hypothetical protein
MNPATIDKPLSSKPLHEINKMTEQLSWTMESFKAGISAPAIPEDYRQTCQQSRSGREEQGGQSGPFADKT